MKKFERSTMRAQTWELKPVRLRSRVLLRRLTPFVMAPAAKRDEPTQLSFPLVWLSSLFIHTSVKYRVERSKFGSDLIVQN